MSWREDLLKKYWRVKIADEAMGMQSIQTARKVTSRLVKKLQDGTIGQQTIEPGDGDDELMVLGDYHVTHPVEQRPGNNGLAKLALATALGLGTLGLGTGAALWGYSQIDKSATNTTIKNTEGFQLELPP